MNNYPDGAWEVPDPGEVDDSCPECGASGNECCVEGCAMMELLLWVARITGREDKAS